MVYGGVVSWPGNEISKVGNYDMGRMNFAGSIIVMAASGSELLRHFVSAAACGMQVFCSCSNYSGQISMFDFLESDL